VVHFFQCRGRCDESDERRVGVFLAGLFCFYDRSLLTGLFYFHVCHLPHHCSCFTDAILFVHQVPCFLYKNYAINDKQYGVRVIVIYSIIFCTTNPIFGVQKPWDKNKEYGVSVMVISPLMMTIGSMFGTAQVRTSVERDLL